MAAENNAVAAADIPIAAGFLEDGVLRGAGLIADVGAAGLGDVSWTVLIHENQVIGVFEWQGAKQHGVNGTEDRGVRADTESERENTDGGDERIAKELSKTKAEVVEEIFQ